MCSNGDPVQPKIVNKSILKIKIKKLKVRASKSQVSGVKLVILTRKPTLLTNCSLLDVEMVTLWKAPDPPR